MGEQKQKTPTRTAGVRVDEARLNELLDKLDKGRQGDVSLERRANARYAFRRLVDVAMPQPDGSVITMKSPTRDISRSGISILHHGYLHVGTSCSIHLKSAQNNRQVVRGRVVNCDYLDGGVHVVGVEFEQLIDITGLCPDAVTRRILVVDDDAAMRKIVTFHLKGMNVQVDSAENGEIALQKIASGPFDAVLLDIEMPVLDGMETVKRLRESNYGGRLVAMTALSGPGDRERLLAGGFDQYIAKPITKEMLADLLARLDEAPLASTLATVEGMAEMIAEFLASLSQRETALEEAIAKSDLPSIEKNARLLKGEAGTFGFEPISQAAERVETMSRDKGDLEAIRKSVNELAHLCRLARRSVC